MPPKTRTRVVAYCRVSTEKQADNGNSLEAQQSKLAQYAALYDLDIVAIEVDAGESASTLNRPALKRALGRLEAFEAEGLLVVKLDRLTRSVRDLCELVDTYFKDGDHHLMSVSESVDTKTASGRLVLNILTTVSQWEREAASERTAAVMQHMKSEGRFTGGWPPFGFKVGEDGELVVDDGEQYIIARARSLKAEGMSLRAIAAALGPVGREGKRFDPKQISRML
jgi:DNA invertase Pin-like site-specific DNA recombinase